MRINKTYHITLPDTIAKEIELLQNSDPILQSRSAVIAHAVHALYLSRKKIESNKTDSIKMQKG